MATIAQAAAHIYCSRAQFDQYLAEGTITRRPSGKYDLDHVRREAFAHLRSVAAGRGGANGNKLTEERVLLTRIKRQREERQAGIEAGQWARLSAVQRFLEGALLGFRSRALGLPGEVADQLAMRSREECFRILDDAIRSKLEELSEDGFAARAAEAGVESENGELNNGSNDNDGNNEDDASDAAE
jgi:hypothetical protein